MYGSFVPSLALAEFQPDRVNYFRRGGLRHRYFDVVAFVFEMEMFVENKAFILNSAAVWLSVFCTGGSGGIMDRYVQDTTQRGSQWAAGNIVSPSVTPTLQASSFPVQSMSGVGGWQTPMFQPPPGFSGWTDPWPPQAQPISSPQARLYGPAHHARAVNLPVLDGTTAWKEFHTQFEMVITFY